MKHELPPSFLPFPLLTSGAAHTSSLLPVEGKEKRERWRGNERERINRLWAPPPLLSFSFSFCFSLKGRGQEWKPSLPSFPFSPLRHLLLSLCLSLSSESRMQVECTHCSVNRVSLLAKSSHMVNCLCMSTANSCVVQWAFFFWLKYLCQHLIVLLRPGKISSTSSAPCSGENCPAWQRSTLVRQGIRGVRHG